MDLQEKRSHAETLARPTVLRAIRAAVVVLLVVGFRLAHADIYASDQSGHSPRFANYPLDATYQLLIRDEAPAQAGVPSAPPTPVDPALLKRRTAIDPLIERIAMRHAVDSALVRAIVEVESGFNARAVSPKGAAGPMQLMPQTAKRYGVSDRLNPIHNLEAGVAHLRDLLNHFRGNVALALAGYNAGQYAVARHRNVIPPYRETMLYVPQVLAAYARYRQEDERSVKGPIDDR